MTRPTRKSDKPGFRIQRVGRVGAAKPKPPTDAEKLEFVLSHKFPKVELCDLEEIETAISQGTLLDDAIRSLLDEYDEVPAEERAQHAADLKAALELKAEAGLPDQLDAHYRQLQEQERQREQSAREEARFFNQP